MAKFRKLSKDEIEELKSKISYDSNTGNFRYKIKASQNTNVGDIVGGFDKDGYCQIPFNNKLYKGHRIAWLFYYDEQPDKMIDHKDSNPSNNCIFNLRLATKSENNQNQKIARSDNKSGYLGVSINKNSRKNPYTASIGLNGKVIRIGSFPTAELAHAAYIKKKKEIHPFFVEVA